MTALEQLANDILDGVDDRVEIAEELESESVSEQALRERLLGKFNALGPEVSVWLTEWLGRSVRRILRRLGIACTEQCPSTMVRHWLEFRGVEYPTPKTECQHLYRELNEILEQFSAAGGAEVPVNFVLPAFDSLLRFVLLHYLQAKGNDEEQWDFLQGLGLAGDLSHESKRDVILPLVSMFDLRSVIEGVSNLGTVQIPPYSPHGTRRVEIADRRERELLTEIGIIANLVQEGDVNEQDSDLLFCYLRELFSRWRSRFPESDMMIPTSAVVFNVTQGIYSRELRCWTEFGTVHSVAGVEEVVEPKVDVLLNPEQSSPGWAANLTLFLKDIPWSCPYHTKSQPRKAPVRQALVAPRISPVKTIRPAMQLGSRNREASIIVGEPTVEPVEQPKSTVPETVFICYSHNDNSSKDQERRWLDRLKVHLEPFLRQSNGRIRAFSDSDVVAGQHWNLEIQKNLLEAKAAILLLSPSFLASEYIATNELPVLLHKAKEHGMAIVPVLVAPCAFNQALYKFPDPSVGPEEFALASLQTVNSPEQTLVELNRGEQERVLHSVALTVDEILSSGRTL